MFIYKIWKEDCDDCYIGSTDDFRKRKILHKHSCNNINHRNHNFKIYTHIRANGGWDSWNKDIIEECEDRCREIELIKEMKPSLNTIYYDYSDTKEYMKEWKKENPDRINEYRNKWREENLDKLKKKFNCECGGKYTYRDKAKHMKTQRHQK